MTGGAYQRDTPCPACGYNLRGLTGDPLRCPECGTETSRARLAELRGPMATRLRNLQSAIDLQTLAILLVMVGVPAALFVFGPRGIAFALLAVVPLGIVLAAIGWRMAKELFLGPGGGRLVARYQAWTTLLVNTYPLIALALGSLLYLVVPFLGFPNEAALVVAALVSVSVVGLLQFSIDPLRRARERQERAFRALVDLTREPDDADRPPTPGAPSLQRPDEADRVSPP